MSTQKLFIADPYNDEHMRLIDEFEERNNLTTRSKTLARNIRRTHTEKTYLEELKTSNEIHQSLFLEGNGEIDDLCYIQAERDRKLCQIFFAPIEYFKSNRKLVELATNYALDILGMEDIFVSLSLDHIPKRLIESLEKNGYESLGPDSNGTIKYLKEKEYIDEQSRGNIKIA